MTPADRIAALEADLRAAQGQVARMRGANNELQKTLRDAAKLLRRGQKAIERQEWEKGETEQEWYHAAGMFTAFVELDAKLSADAALVAPDPGAESEAGKG